MIDTWQKAEKYGEKASKNGKKPAKKRRKTAKNGEKAAKNDEKAAKMVRIAVRLAWFLTFGRCQRNHWVPPKKPMGAAEETDGFLGRNRWFPLRHRRKPHVRRFKTDGRNKIRGRGLRLQYDLGTLILRSDRIYQ